MTGYPGKLLKMRWHHRTNSVVNGPNDGLAKRRGGHDLPPPRRRDQSSEGLAPAAPWARRECACNGTSLEGGKESSEVPKHVLAKAQTSQREQETCTWRPWGLGERLCGQLACRRV
jgi:hypothetical protein